MLQIKQPNYRITVVRNEILITNHTNTGEELVVTEAARVAGLSLVERADARAANPVRRSRHLLLSLQNNVLQFINSSLRMHNILTSSGVIILSTGSVSKIKDAS